MKIIYLHQYFNTPAMTGGTRSYEMARRLVRAGHEVHLLTSERGGQRSSLHKWKVENIEGIVVHWLPVPYSNAMNVAERIGAFGRFAYAAARRAASIPADLIFATSTPLTIAIPAIYAARKGAIPMVLEVRDLWPELPIAIGALKNPILRVLARRLEHIAYQESVRIIALSDGMKEGIARTGYPEQKIFVIPNSSDLDVFDIGSDVGKELRAQYSWLQDRPLVLYLGTLGRINGVDYLVRLAAAVRQRDPEIRFVVVGRGKEEAVIKKQAQDMGVLNVNFFMLEAIPKSETPRWLSAADIATSLFIDLKPMWANSANKFFDALAARKPLAINYGGWQASLLQRTGAGVVLDAHNMDLAADDIVAALHDPEWLRRSSAAAGRLAENTFARDTLAEQFGYVLREAQREATIFRVKY